MSNLNAWRPENKACQNAQSVRTQDSANVCIDLTLLLQLRLLRDLKSPKTTGPFAGAINLQKIFQVHIIVNELPTTLIFPFIKEIWASMLKVFFVKFRNFAVHGRPHIRNTTFILPYCLTWRAPAQNFLAYLLDNILALLAMLMALLTKPPCWRMREVAHDAVIHFHSTFMWYSHFLHHLARCKAWREVRSSNISFYTELENATDIYVCLINHLKLNCNLKLAHLHYAHSKHPYLYI